MSSICLRIYRERETFLSCFATILLIACVNFVQNNSILKSVFNDEETNDANRNSDFIHASRINKTEN